MQHGPLVGVFGVLGHLPVLVDPCGQYMGKNLDPSKEFVKAPGWLLAVDMLQPRVPTPPYPHTSLSVRGHLCSTQMNPPAPQLCRGCLVATWRGVNVWQLSLRLSGVMFWGGAGKLQPYNYCQSAPECGDQSSDKPLSGAKGRLSAGYSELDLTSLTISSLLGPQHSRMLLSGGR